MCGVGRIADVIVSRLRAWRGARDRGSTRHARTAHARSRAKGGSELHLMTASRLSHDNLMITSRLPHDCLAITSQLPHVAYTLLPNYLQVPHDYLEVEVAVRSAHGVEHGDRVEGGTAALLAPTDTSQTMGGISGKGAVVLCGSEEWPQTPSKRRGCIVCSNAWRAGQHSTERRCGRSMGVAERIASNISVGIGRQLSGAARTRGA